MMTSAVPPLWLMGAAALSDPDRTEDLKALPSWCACFSDFPFKYHAIHCLPDHSEERLLRRESSALVPGCSPACVLH